MFTARCISRWDSIVSDVVGSVGTVRELIVLPEEAPQDWRVVTQQGDDPDDVAGVRGVDAGEADDEHPAQETTPQGLRFR